MCICNENNRKYYTVSRVERFWRYTPHDLEYADSDLEIGFISLAKLAVLCISYIYIYKRLYSFQYYFHIKLYASSVFQQAEKLSLHFHIVLSASVNSHL